MFLCFVEVVVDLVGFYLVFVVFQFFVWMLGEQVEGNVQGQFVFLYCLDWGIVVLWEVEFIVVGVDYVCEVEMCQFVEQLLCGIFCGVGVQWWQFGEYCVEQVGVWCCFYEVGGFVSVVVFDFGVWWYFYVFEVQGGYVCLVEYDDVVEVLYIDGYCG